MAKITFGRTWWGQQWLHELSEIDQEERLPKGRADASKGAVSEIKIEDGTVYARIRSKHGTYLKQTFKIEHRISEEERAFIIDRLMEDDHMVTLLIAGQLPNSLFEICKEANIHLFPKDWNYLYTHCTCPDRKPLCKHIASIIYVLANEIDRNPFLIFELNGIHLPEILASKGISIHQQTSASIPKLPELTVDEPEEYDYYPENIKKLDFSNIPELSELLFSLLSDSPLFSAKNFKDVLKKVYKNASRKAEKPESPDYDDYEEYHRKLKFAESIAIAIDPDMTIIEVLCYTHKNFERFSGNKVFDMSVLMATIQSLKEEELIQYPYEVQLLYYLYLFSIKLTVSSAYIPQIIETANKEHNIRYIPAHISPEIQEVYKVLETLIPPDMLVNRSSDGNGFFKPTEAINFICHYFIQYFIIEGSQTVILPETDQLVFDCFFGDYAVPFNESSKKAVPITIYRWLGKFFLKHKKYTPLLQLDEEEERFFLRVFVEDQEVPTEPISLHKFLEDPQYTQHKFDVLHDLNLLTEHFSALEQVMADKGRQALMMDSFEVVVILTEILPIIEMLGIHVMMPKSLRNLMSPKLTLSLDSNHSSSGEAESMLSLEDMLDFDWQVAVGDETLSADEFKAAVDNASGLVKIAGQFVLIDQAEIRKLLEQLENPPKVKTHELMHAALSKEYEGAHVAISEKMQGMVRRLVDIEEIVPPKGLKAQLRPYQKTGYEWMFKNARLGFGSLIADDMGLGKTLQVITTLLKMKEEGLLDKKKALIIVPTSLLTNWEKEIAKFAPGLKAYIFHGSQRKAPPKGVDIIITTYGVIRTDKDVLKKMKFYCVVIDEAQNIKNTATAQTKAVKAIKSDLKIAMSGTPVENRLSEYWSIMDFTNKGYLGTLGNFTSHYAKPIQKDRDLKKLEQFMKITEPFILRRVKSDKSIIKDLPDKVENNQYCPLTTEQAAIYQNVVDDILKKVQKEKKESVERKGLILKLMMSLKQICNHPYQYMKKGDANPEISGKAQRLFELLDAIQENGQKTLIFTQYREMGDLLSDWIEERYGKRPLFLHGGTSRAQRDEMVDDFQSNHATNIFILSLKAGGTGLNLTAASNVIHYDLWWNPAVEAQATDRAYRIGQTNNVMVHRLITQSTFEEKIDDMLHSKKELANLTVNTGEKWIGDLSNEELQNIVKIKY
ncbi:SNF2-related protein [Algivirga pacifica]|uniref:DEAD/DEAH box helicase n=1 Tax=Algivirga pacifica TaxID=1162670 RepID=A0ABP9DL88_9BACT